MTVNKQEENETEARRKYGRMEPLKERSKMDSAFMWDLTRMYASDEDWERDLEALSRAS